MKPNEYFEKSTGPFPPPGVVGVEGEWMDMGLITVPYGQLWAGDLYDLEGDSGCIVSVPRGQYHVQIRAMSFRAHRRTSRIRAFHNDIAEPTLGAKRGEVGSDCGLFGLYDLTAFKKIVGRTHRKQYGHDIMESTMEEIVGCVGREYGGKRFDVAFSPCGLGDGRFAAQALKSGKRNVGVEVQFLPRGFSVER